LVFPWNELSRRKQGGNDENPKKNNVIKIISLFLIAALAGGLFVWRRYVSRYEAEKARIEQAVKLNQADKARALRKYGKQQNAQQPVLPKPNPFPQNGSKLPPGSIPHAPQGSVQAPVQHQPGSTVVPPTPVQPGKPR